MCSRNQPAQLRTAHANYNRVHKRAYHRAAKSFQLRTNVWQGAVTLSAHDSYLTQLPKGRRVRSHQGPFSGCRNYRHCVGARQFSGKRLNFENVNSGQQPPCFAWTKSRPDAAATGAAFRRWRFRLRMWDFAKRNWLRLETLPRVLGSVTIGRPL